MFNREDLESALEVSMVNDMVKTPGRQVAILEGPWAYGNGRTIRANGNAVTVWVFRAGCEVEYDVSDLDIDRS